MILSSAHRHNAALIAHESCHQSQQRRDGTLTFWYRYLTNKSWRLSYEVEAYEAWLAVAPDDLYKVARVLSTKYGLDLSFDVSVGLLKPEN
jgi:hypothetical protein